MNGDLIPDLYELLPAVYRIEDAKRGYPLQALLRLVSQQASAVKQDIDRLWDDFFVETCQDWVLPYLGDLVGTTPLHEAVVRRRADVAKTIYYRRRKGTLPMLEELARDVTGWGAHAVAFFEQLGWSQNLNHFRYQWAPTPLRTPPDCVDRVGTVNLRNLDALDRLDGPFDLATHTVDVRPIQSAEGWYNIRRIGFFIWRLESYHLIEVPLEVASVPFGYTASTLGRPLTLFTQPERETDDSGLAREIHVPGPVRPLALHFDLEAARQAVADGHATASAYVGAGRSLEIALIAASGAAQIVPPEEMIVMDLSTWRQPAAALADNTGRVWPIRLGLDPRLGRFVFAVGREPAPDERVEASYNYGFSADLGSGPYDRRKTLAAPDGSTWRALVSKEQPDPPPTDPWFSTLDGALVAWSTAGGAGPPSHAVIEILDNAIYEETLVLDLTGAQSLTIQASDGKRPTLRLMPPFGSGPGALRVESAGHTEAALVLNGLLIAGGVVVSNDPDSRNSLGRLSLMHCTLVPGQRLDEDGRALHPDVPSIEVTEPFTGIRVTLEHSISGWLLLAAENVEFQASDSIIDALPEQHPANVTPVLVSGNLAAFGGLSADVPTLAITLGDQGPFIARFDPLQSPYDTLAKARAGLESAIHQAHSTPAFAETRVILDTAGEQLLVVPGRPVRVQIAAAMNGAATDPAAAELQLLLQTTGAVLASGLKSGPLPASLSLSAAAPALLALAGSGPEARLELDATSPPTTPADARDQLRTALHAVDLGSIALNAPYHDARVELLDIASGHALLVISGTGAAIVFRPADDDRDTIAELGLVTQRAALSGSHGGDSLGPPARLERVTIFGLTRIRVCSLASEVIFTGPLVAERRQDGCVRFSYLAPGSRAPRRYRCQPDLALASRAEELGLTSHDDLPPLTQRRVHHRIRPDFTSEHYGDAGYAQLSLTTALEVRTGAEDGSEMGVFSLLKQPQREANLRLRLEEYLPFGLEPGSLFVT
jgi:hypothetical protein